MKLFNRLVILLMAGLGSLSAPAQTDSCNLKVSLLTASPGDELYSIFGHSAIRITDNRTGTDIIYNYGSFEFDDNFYYNFVLGGDRLQYYVAAERFSDYMREYKVYNRSVIEQTIQLGCEEKEKLFVALQVNTRKENRYYRYDFLFDNCATRLRDIIIAHTSSPTVFKNILPPEPPSFRNLIHEYLNGGKQYWSKLGIDLLLGSKMDRKVTNTEAMFLPDYLLKGLDSALMNNIPLVRSKELILPSSRMEELQEPLFRPMVLTIFLFVFGTLLSFFKTTWARTALNIFDSMLFFILGAIGTLILFMWFGTDHALCASNYNLLWASPTHLAALFLINKKTSIAKVYFRAFSLIYLVLILVWVFLPQGMNPAFFPIAILAGCRCFERFRKI